MIRFILFFLLSQTLAQAETLTRAYFAGKNQVQTWIYNESELLNPTDSRDPFGGGDPANDKIPSPPAPHKAPPFDSPHFRTGDTLYDFKAFKENLKNIDGKLEHAIYNETTGRFIVKGEPSAHWLFHSLAIRTAERSPQLIELSFEFLEDNQTIFATTIRTLPGQATEVKVGAITHKLQLITEALTYHEDNYTECSLKLDGTIRNQPFKLHTGLHLIDGIPNPIELGMTNPEEKPLTLYLTSHVILHGDVRKSDLILDESGQPVKRDKRFNAHHQLYQEGITDAKTGFLLQAYRLPPTFLTFLSSNSDNQADPDPFGGGAEATPEEIDYKYLKNRDPRIPASPTDRVIDITDLLAKNGVGLQHGEFAAFNLETDTLFVLAKPITNELIQGIVTPVGSWGNLRSITTQIKLIESSVKPTPQSLGKEDQTTLFQTAIDALPGQSSSLILGPLHLDLEAQIDANDSIIESRLELTEKSGKETTLQFKSGLTLETGIPQIVQSTFVNGKWQSLVVTGTVVQKSEHDK